MTGGWHAVRLVAGREIRQVGRSKTFWVVCTLVFSASVAVAVLPEVLAGDDTPRYEVGVVDGRPGIGDALQQAVADIDAELQLSEVADEADARRQVSDDLIDVAVLAGAEPVVVVQAGEHEQLVVVARQALAAHALESGLQDAGLDDAAVRALVEAPPARVIELDTDRDSRRAAAFGLSLAMYLVLLMLMMSVANGTAVEKSNRVSEVLLAIVRPGSLLFGKVLGVGLAGLFTALCGAAPLIVKLASGGDLPDGFGPALAGAALWFVLGASLYLVMAGSLGALAERQEEAGTITAPLNMVLIAAYIFGGSAPESAAAEVLGYVPLTAPLVMPSRMAVGAASGVELAVSVSCMVAAIAIVARVGSIVYRRAIVRTGRRLKVREVLRGA